MYVVAVTVCCGGGGGGEEGGEGLFGEGEMGYLASFNALN